jgi:hypothetical protein
MRIARISTLMALDITSSLIFFWQTSVKYKILPTEFIL